MRNTKHKSSDDEEWGKLARDFAPEDGALCIHIIDFGIKINSVIWYFAQIPLGLPSTFFFVLRLHSLERYIFLMFLSLRSRVVVFRFLCRFPLAVHPQRVSGRDRNVWGNNVITIPLHSRHGYILLCPRSFLVGEWLNHITTKRSADLKYEFIFTEKFKAGELERDGISLEKQSWHLVDLSTLSFPLSFYSSENKLSKRNLEFKKSFWNKNHFKASTISTITNKAFQDAPSVESQNFQGS